MKKVLVFCLLTVFSAFYAVSAWGADVSPWTKGNVIVTLSGTTLTLSPIPGTNGVMEDLTEDDTKDWRKSANRGNVQTIIIEDGVTQIGAYAFYYCLDITSIKIPKSVACFRTKAFYSSNGTPKIYYAGTPNEWANIDFTDEYSHPFYGDASSARHMYFYNQTSTETTILVFTPGITNIKQYAFYYAKSITDVNIPHSVTSIGSDAFRHCANLCRIFVLNTNAPSTTNTTVFNGMKAGSSASWLYLPQNANPSTSAPGFKRLPWYDSSQAGHGAARIGYEGTDVSACSGASGFGIDKSKVYPTSGTVDGISWSINNDGVLTLNGSGAITTSFVTNTGNSALYPWWRWHNLVTKVIIKGNITNLSNALSRFDALTEIEIQQGTIPTSSTSVPSASYYILHDNITLRIPLALIDDAQLESAPWNNMNVTLSEIAVIDENVDNTTLLTALHNKLSAPFTMQFTRSLTNASYNTFCSPVPLTAAQLGGADIRALESTTYDDGSEELYLNFSSTPLSAVEAGVPYLIKPSSTISNPTFTDVDPGSVVVDPETVETSEVDFHGVLKPTTLTGGDKSILFLGAGNELFWPATTGDIKGLRAYFEIKEGSGARRAVRARMNMDGHSTPMNIKNVQGNNVQCTKILRDGKLYLMYDGKMYDVQGRVIDDL